MVNTHYIEEVFNLRASRIRCFAALTLVLQFFSVAFRNFLLLEVQEITSLILSLPSKLMQFQKLQILPRRCRQSTCRTFGKKPLVSASPKSEQQKKTKKTF